MKTAEELGFRGVGEGLWNLRRRGRMKQRLGIASWHSGKATEMDAAEQQEAEGEAF